MTKANVNGLCVGSQLPFRDLPRVGFIETRQPAEHGRTKMVEIILIGFIALVSTLGVSSFFTLGAKLIVTIIIACFAKPDSI